MHKIIILPLVLLQSLVFAQSSAPDKKQHLQHNAIKMNQDTNPKVLRYQISIKEDNRDIFKSSFFIKTGQEFILFNKEMTKQNKDANKKAGLLNDEGIMSQSQGEEKDMISLEQLKLTSRIEKNNISSEFSIHIMEMENTKKISTLSKDDKAMVIESVPSINSHQSKALINHRNHYETSFLLDKKQFIIKADY